MSISLTTTCRALPYEWRHRKPRDPKSGHAYAGRYFLTEIGPMLYELSFSTSLIRSSSDRSFM